MADNFDVKQFLFENKLGAYSRLKTEGEAAYEYEKGKAAGEKEEKEKLTKEDIGGDIGDAQAEKMMDFLAEYEVIYVYGEDGKCYRKDDEGNYDRVDNYYCKRYAGTGVREAKEKVEEAMALKLKGYYQILDAGTDEWHDDYQYMGRIAGGSSAGEVGEHMFVYPDSPGAFTFVSIPDADLDTMVKPSMSEGKKEEESLNEALEPHVYERMYNLSNIKAQQAMIKAAEILMNDLTAEGFEVPEIREFFTQLIANDI